MTHPDTVIDVWFGPLTDGFADEVHRKRWFESSPAFDEEIRDRFGAALRAVASGGLAEWRNSPRGALAYILITDQFSRQIHRGTAQAFATDALALEAAKTGLRDRHDATLAFDERAFFYLPFEHSESAADQARSVALFTRLRDDTPKGWRHLTGDYLRHAEKHRDIVERFGRFPHRNASLGRESTAEEREYLETAARFGQ